MIIKISANLNIEKMELSVCGLNCVECPFHGKECPGCYLVEGKTFWALEAMPSKICPIFDCSVNQRNFKNCGECSEIPCKIFTNLKDPNVSELDHELSIQKRVLLLKPKQH